MKIKLINNRGKSWSHFDGSYIKGFAFFNNTLLSEHEIYKELVDSIKVDKLDQKLLELNGNFSGVLHVNDEIYLLSDKLKTYPILYSNIDGKWLVTDQSKVILDTISKLKFNRNSIMTYLTVGYLHGNHTFIDNCNIVSAGTYVVLKDKAFVYKYHKHIYKKKLLIDNKEIINYCTKSLEDSIKRMLLSIGDRPIWLPLSGGYDSRLLACLFKKLNVKNVKCFTYGIAESYEIKTSEKVAKILGFEWHYIEYTEELFLSVADSPIDDDYIFWAMNLNTTSHYQDFIAFKELKDKGIIEDDAIIVPGHSGEILGRDQVPYKLLETNKSIANLIYYKYFQWNTPKRKYKKQILDSLGIALNLKISNENKADTVDLFTNWNIQNRQSNFIVNAVRVYEYFGNDWRVPLWDDKLSEFWFSLPLEKNSNVQLYNHFIFEKYFIPMGVAIYKETNITKKLLSRIRIPFNIKPIIKKELSKLNYFKAYYDNNGFNYRADYYLKKIGNYKSPYILFNKTNTNSVIALYQIFLLESYIKKHK